MSKIMETQRNIEKGVIAGYKAIEGAVVSGYKAIEDGVVARYKKIESKFVDTFLTPEGQAEPTNTTNNNYKEENLS